MVWQIEFDKRAMKELSKAEPQIQRRMIAFLRDKVAQDPKAFGAPLQSNLSGLWKFRMGDYRIIAELWEEKITVMVLRIGHRKNIYGGH
ncbi:type II toxin-antitoxin system RelE/ParE family toxin [Desulfobotulus sp. H1]|uniref:mRNA interferase RelE/StbE n=2 Tax=Desulfobotulus TaxID=48001 RepID=A0A562S5W7_9BACT|nr:MULTISPECIES: type II toxin-antitoxin system RelE/ParE family toxin [Desulfobotulus]MCW7754045.1 type II toxin-antitoxin system RelE/ParE family toxin [Desulfobotulus pelophilus]TWI76731.1 mRNA interferase RelE/StbE [Desulfobotulus alkaliphilus]